MGAPIGNKNGANGREWREAIRYALAQEYDGLAERGMALKRLAMNVVKDGLSGNLQCIQEVGNRLDGKPTQGIEVSGEQSFLSLILEFAAQRERRVPVDNPDIGVEQHITH